jgi:hypothetical protein
MQEKILSLPIESMVFSRAVIFTIISVVSFFTSFLLGHPQWLVGTIVNAGLFLSAIYLPKKYFLPIAIFPSLGVLARGLVFGPFTAFLIYFLPFIWAGNLVLILLFRFIYSKIFHNFGIAAITSAIVKFAVLFLTANAYFKFNFAPAVFLQLMGLNQLATALAGGAIGFVILKFNNLDLIKNFKFKI